MKRTVGRLCSSRPCASALRSLDLPELSVFDSPVPCVASLQSYSTVHGPALSAMFDRNPNVFSFQRTPFALSGAPLCYLHALMDSLFEFAETPRSTAASQRGVRDVDVVAPPMADLSQQCGALNTVYYTLHVPAATITSEVASAGASPRSAPHARTASPLVLPHPTYGCVEPTRSEHRGGRAMDLRSSLFDDHSRAICTAVVTGVDGEDNSPAPRLVLDGSTATLEKLLHRRTHPLESMMVAAEKSPLQTTADGLRSALVALSGGCFGMALQVSELGSPPQSHESIERLAVVAPWVILRMVLVFSAAVAEEISFPGPSLSSAAASDGASQATRTTSWSWSLASYHATQTADLDPSLPVELVAAPPKPFASYTMPPWKHRIGLPTLCGAPCLALHVELRQRGRVAGSGVYYLTPVPGP